MMLSECVFWDGDGDGDGGIYFKNYREGYRAQLFLNYCKSIIEKITREWFRL
jgi:hypothetical protein